MPAPRPRHPKPKIAYSPRHARAMPAPRPRHCPVTPGITGHWRGHGAGVARAAWAAARDLAGSVVPPALAGRCSYGGPLESGEIKSGVEEGLVPGGHITIPGMAASQVLKLSCRTLLVGPSLKRSGNGDHFGPAGSCWEHAGVAAIPGSWCVSQVAPPPMCGQIKCGQSGQLESGQIKSGERAKNENMNKRGTSAGTRACLLHLPGTCTLADRFPRIHTSTACRTKYCISLTEFVVTVLEAVIPNEQGTPPRILLWTTYFPGSGNMCPYGPHLFGRPEPEPGTCPLADRTFKNSPQPWDQPGENRGGTEQNRPEQSRAEQSRAEQSRAEQSRAEHNRAEQSRTDMGG
eukprot:gene10197-biopygen221